MIIIQVTNKVIVTFSTFSFDGGKIYFFQFQYHQTLKFL